MVRYGTTIRRVQPDISRGRFVPVRRAAGLGHYNGLAIDGGLLRALPIFISGYLVGRVIVLVCAFLSETVVARNPALTSG